MTLMDEREVQGLQPKTVEMACPVVAAALTADGAYTADVLRIVRGTPNAEEMAALVAALLFTRRAHETREASTNSANSDSSDSSDCSDDQHHRPSWLREGYTPPGAWTAGP